LEGVFVDAGAAALVSVVAAGAVVESAGAVVPLVEAALVSADVVLVSAGGGLDAAEVSSALLLQPTNAKGKAKVRAARREYFSRRLFMDSFIRGDAGG
jgi:hypothetical protein